MLVSGLAACRGGNTSAGRGDVAEIQRDFWKKTKGKIPQRQIQLASLQVPEPVIADAEFVEDDELCMACHETYAKKWKNNVHRGQSCEKCHGPGSRHVSTRGREPGTILSFKTLSAPQKSEICLKCHTENQCAPGANWRTSKHAHNGVSCNDCHTSHYNVPAGTPGTSLPGADETALNAQAPQIRKVAFEQQDEPELSMDEIRVLAKNLGAIEPHICFKCHSNMQDLAHVAHPHQIGGQHGFTCTTCHNPHGVVKPETRQDLCLKCHTDAPTMPWHSGSHAMWGVACTDCHNPHPRASVQSVIQVDHWQSRPTPRMPMSVDDPNVCYKCHADIYARNAMPSHHPIKEGKMVCGDCHDPHSQGQMQGNLRDQTVNLVCYRCHADKQGPFTYEHPPVTENCGICHEPHGTVANNLLHQPTTFLCLRCHTGHRTGSSTVSPGFPGGHPGSPPLADVGSNAGLQRAFYSDCTQCHAQIHGSDLPAPHRAKSFTR